jgi:hypothetical protein
MIRNPQDHFRGLYDLYGPYHEHPSSLCKRESSVTGVQPEANSSPRLCPDLQVLQGKIRKGCPHSYTKGQPGDQPRNAFAVHLIPSVLIRRPKHPLMIPGLFSPLGRFIRRAAPARSSGIVHVLAWRCRTIEAEPPTAAFLCRGEQLTVCSS